MSLGDFNNSMPYSAAPCDLGVHKRVRLCDGKIKGHYGRMQMHDTLLGIVGRSAADDMTVI